MTQQAIGYALAAAALVSLGACGKQSDKDGPRAQTPQAEKAAGAHTIADGLPPNSRFIAAAKAAGLDQTLAGPGPYTLFLPSDQAIAQAPSGTFDANPANRSRLTATITNLILQGTVLVADIDKAIEANKGKAPLATVAGGTLTATREGGRTVLVDSQGNKAAIVSGDREFSNGVVHEIDGLLLPPGPPSK